MLFKDNDLRIFTALAGHLFYSSLCSARYPSLDALSMGLENDWGVCILVFGKPRCPGTWCLQPRPCQYCSCRLPEPMLLFMQYKWSKSHPAALPGLSLGLLNNPTHSLILSLPWLVTLSQFLEEATYLVLVCTVLLLPTYEYHTYVHAIVLILPFFFTRGH
jgi:hypothetical protein